MPKDQPVYRCPFCPVPFYTRIGRDDHVSYRHNHETALIEEVTCV